MQDLNDPRLAKLLQKREQLEKQIALKKTRLKAVERTQDTRRKILAGAFLLDVMYKGKEEDLKQLLDGFLTRDNDRVLFGLTLKENSETEIKGNNKQKAKSQSS